MNINIDDTDLSSILFVECVLQKFRDDVSMLDLRPPKGGGCTLHHCLFGAEDCWQQY